MFLRQSRHKRVHGKEVLYLQLAESVWEDGRSKTRVVYNFGRADDPEVVEKLRALGRSILKRVAPEDLVVDNPGWRLLHAWPYGDVYALDQLWRRLGLKTLFEQIAGREDRRSLPFERACFAMVANRACAPSSKLYCYEQWLAEDVRFEGSGELSLHHLYRSMDLLEKHREEIEEALFLRLCDLFSLDVEVIFYDTTSLHFEIDEEDARGAKDATLGGSKAAGAKRYEALRQRGRSKNKRSDVPQIVVGMAMTRDGLPIRSWVFRGDTVDVKTVAKVKKDLQKWRLSRCVFVGDAGMVSEENLRTLSKSGGKYIVCMPLHQGSEAETIALASTKGRFKEVRPNLKVKEVTIGDGAREKRYVLCFNPEEAKRQRKHREQVIAELEAELDALDDLDGRAHTKRECWLRASGRYGRYLRTDKRSSLLSLNRAAMTRAEKLDGKFVVHSNDDTLTAEDLALGYKQLADVERAWRQLKSSLRIRPVYHRAPHRICAHVALTTLALLLVRLAENACADTWRNIRDDLRQIQCAHLSTPHGDLQQVTEGPSGARRRLKSLGIASPPPILDVSL